jgi:hypothetical protein
MKYPHLGFWIFSDKFYLQESFAWQAHLACDLKKHHSPWHQKHLLRHNQGENKGVQFCLTYLLSFTLLTNNHKINRTSSPARHTSEASERQVFAAVVVLVGHGPTSV